MDHIIKLPEPQKELDFPLRKKAVKQKMARYAHLRARNLKPFMGSIRYSKRKIRKGKMQ